MVLQFIGSFVNKMPPKTTTQRAELHTHLGASVDPPLLWDIAHRQGIKLPGKTYWDFEDLITMTGKDRNRSLEDMDKHFFHWTELIQSSPEAVEESVKSVIGGGYRACNLVLQELRFNPMKRNRGGERDLDHIIMSAIWGLDKATLEYPQVKAGIILMMDRTLSFKQNEIIVKKAIKYKPQGIIGIDLAGPWRKNFDMKQHAPLFAMARKAGLGITVHTGEEGNLEEMRFVVKEIKPDRVGHGILCYKDSQLMKQIVKNKITLEICPTSNLRNSVLKNVEELRTAVRALVKNRVRFTINTDGPEMYSTNIYEEQEFLRREKILSTAEIAACTRWAFEASFIRN
ncbi:MAG: Adenosine deaminase [Parcubacteria group bacterium GW2011_GWA2_51_12]|nr:MAG: Adenosine deaminase [Parcubacteria group bacterium GW2011_GWA2_51_12]